jgi:hypothetical protein
MEIALEFSERDTKKGSRALVYPVSPLTEGNPAQGNRSSTEIDRWNIESVSALGMSMETWGFPYPARLFDSEFFI